MFTICIEMHVFLFRSINNKPIDKFYRHFWADIHDYSLFCSEIVLNFLNCMLLAQNIQFVYIVEILAACPWSCTCCTPRLQKWLTAHHMQHLRCWLVNKDTCKCWRLPLIWLTAQEDSSWHDIFEDPALHTGRNWGSTLLHLNITVDPPFYTCYK